jgi:hypothetical protein
MATGVIPVKLTVPLNILVSMLYEKLALPVAEEVLGGVSAEPVIVAVNVTTLAGLSLSFEQETKNAEAINNKPAAKCVRVIGFKFKMK